jgi:hypothetical protein
MPTLQTPTRPHSNHTPFHPPTCSVTLLCILGLTPAAGQQQCKDKILEEFSSLGPSLSNTSTAGCSHAQLLSQPFQHRDGKVLTGSLNWCKHACRMGHLGKARALVLHTCTRRSLLQEMWSALVFSKSTWAHLKRYSLCRRYAHATMVGSGGAILSISSGAGICSHDGDGDKCYQHTNIIASCASYGSHALLQHTDSHHCVSLRLRRCLLLSSTAPHGHG